MIRESIPSQHAEHKAQDTICYLSFWIDPLQGPVVPAQCQKNIL